MNATRLGDIRLPASGLARANENDPTDQQMEQIRELLFGEMKRQSDIRFAQLESRMDAMEARIGAMAAEVDAERRTSFDALARGVSELGEHIRRATNKA